MILGSLTKQVNETFPVTADFAQMLASGETISSGTVTSRDVPTGADTTATLFTGSATVSGTKLTRKLGTGAAVDTEHLAEFRITTSAGNVYEAEIRVQVRES